MKILTIVFIIFSSFNFQEVGDIIDCKISSKNKSSYIVSCNEFDDQKVLKVNWPKEWKDSTKIGDIVKFKVVQDNIALPFKSCVAREKERLEEYKKRGMGQLQRPTNLPVDKDCQ